MHNKNKNKNILISFWQTEKFPLVHLGDKTSFIKKWFFHPVKRRLAKLYLSFLKNFTGIKVIAITGSAGKTTTKEMVASILKLDGSTVYSKDNIDPTYNIPTTILKTKVGTKYLILEMGVEYPGEMDFYLWLAKPDIGVITNIFPTHLEFLGDVDGVFKEKSELVLSLPKDKTAILNSGDIKLKSLIGRIKANVLWFEGSGDGLSLNSPTAIAVANALGISKEKIIEGLNNYQRPKHRLSLFTLKSGAIILDDSYNSNPNALSLSLDYFASKVGNMTKIAVLGDMRELGEFEEKLHRLIGKKIAKMNFKAVIGVGQAITYLLDEVRKDNKNIKTFQVDSYKKVIPLLKPYLAKGNSILIKGSRSISLDKVVDSLV